MNVDNLRQEYIQTLATVLANDTDAVFVEAINRLLQRSDWTLDELQGRLVRAIRPNGDEHIFLDETPLVVLYPIETEQEGTRISVVRRYRILVPKT